MRLIKGRRGKSELLNSLIKGEGYDNRLVVCFNPYHIHLQRPYYQMQRWDSMAQLISTISKLVDKKNAKVVYVYGKFKDSDIILFRDIENKVSSLTVTVQADDGTDNIRIEYT